MMNTDDAPRGWLALTGGAVPALRVVLRSDAAEAAVLYGPFRRLHQLATPPAALAEATGVRDCALGTPGVGASARGACLRAELGACACPGSAAGRVGRGLRRARGRGARLPRRPHPPAGRDAAGAHARGQRRLAVRARRGAARAAPRARMARRAARAVPRRGRPVVLYIQTVRRRRRRRPGAGVPRAARHRARRAACARRREDEAALAALARRVYAAPDGVDGAAAADLPTHDLDEFYLVASWFRRHPEELARTSAPPAPPPATPPAAPAHPARRRGARRVAADAPER
jgi:hypothetical protein